MYNHTYTNEFLLIQHFIEEKCGITFDDDKTYLLESKLSNLLKELNIHGYESLYTKICHENNPFIIESVIDAITINETFWFRDKTPWYILEDILLPTYIEELRNKTKDKIKIWSTACSYGQEPYSIAICINNYLIKNNIKDVSLKNFDIIASDISKTALNAAEEAKYDNISISRGLDDDYKYRYFHNSGRLWLLDEQIRKAVSFKQFNLIWDTYSYNEFDAVFCRYVLIYFSDKNRNEVIDNIALCLKNNGSLFIGSSELFEDHTKYFRLNEYKNGQYYIKQKLHGIL